MSVSGEVRTSGDDSMMELCAVGRFSIYFRRGE